MKIAHTVILLVAAVLWIGQPGAINAEESFYEPMPEMTHPKDNPWSKEKEELGKMLYFDPRLSGSNWISCASCHNPGLGWGDGLPTPIGDGFNRKGPRHSPTVINSGYFDAQFWDGRAPSLEEQAKGPIQADIEMNQDVGALIEELKAIPGYVQRFDAVFGKNSINLGNIVKAIATFERSVVSKNSPYDKYNNGDKKAMSKSAINGMNLFFGKAKCAICHNGPVFTDSKFHNIGVKGDDKGRYKVTKEDSDKGAFKTPGLRHVSRTAPYMHDGSEKTLKDVIEFYNRGGDVDENKSPFITPLGLSDKEVNDLVEFMKALEGEPIEIAIPELP
ncbi:cytochrome-c peroxidase [Nitrospina watsonii]|uniref:Methylamine utilization protein MauG n=1 Tax=Nitrospina watsonii TaxID=1323948 RepID=A0ABM9HG98_9BACT|nr:cytochrome-c peroxidase [Nitrospina watsonii]CAI2719177.1 Methylamine utilization protein MauG [Nitrospina watsonii]